MKRALVLGVNGQDGGYLAQRLLDEGWIVVGVGRQPSSRWINTDDQRFHYYCLDLSDTSAPSLFLTEIKPDVIFHFAAIHGSAGFEYEAHWRDVHSVNTVSVHAVLEYMRCSSPLGILIYASSSKVFGDIAGNLISESSTRLSSCIYTTTKNAATDLIRYYRARYQLKASVIWTFNHESLRRGKEYFMPKVVENLANSLLNKNHVGTIASTSFWADWSDADEFMDLTVRIANMAAGQDFVLASGNTVWAADFVDALYAKFGLTSSNVLIPQYNNKKYEPWVVDISLLKQKIKSFPRRSALDIATDLLRFNYPEAWERTHFRL